MAFLGSPRIRVFPFSGILYGFLASIDIPPDEEFLSVVTGPGSPDDYRPPPPNALPSLAACALRGIDPALWRGFPLRLMRKG